MHSSRSDPAVAEDATGEIGWASGQSSFGLPVAFQTELHNSACICCRVHKKFDLVVGRDSDVSEGFSVQLLLITTSIYLRMYACCYLMIVAEWTRYS